MLARGIDRGHPVDSFLLARADDAGAASHSARPLGLSPKVRSVKRRDNHRLCWDGMVRIWAKIEGVWTIVAVYDPETKEEAA